MNAVVLGAAKRFRRGDTGRSSVKWSIPKKPARRYVWV